jgi:hypothetical protein
LYPPDIFSLLRALAVEQGMATDQIDGIVQLGGYQYVPTAPNPTSARRVKRSQEYDAYGYLNGLDGSPERLAPIGNETGDALVFSQESKRGLEKRNIYTGCVRSA